jgi:signal peptidase
VSEIAHPVINRVPHPIARGLRLGLGWGLLLLVLGLAAVMIGVPLATGSVPLTVQTNSMAPTYPAGTVVVVRPVEPSAIRIGDAIAFQTVSGRDSIVTHRVIAISSSAGDRTFSTQGDNSDQPDADTVIPDQVRGAVWYSIPWVGYLTTVVGANREWIVPALAVGLFLFAGYNFTGGLAGAARKRRHNRPAALPE